MKYYQELSLLQVFNKNDLDQITGSNEASKQILKNYVNKEIIKKISYNYYGVVDFSSGDLIGDKFMIGSNINETAFISHRSAFEFYGYYNQVYNTLYISSSSQFKSFEYDGLTYKFIQDKSQEQVEVIRGVKVSSIERTIVDSIADLDKVADLEEVLKCINLVTYIDEKKLLDYLVSVNQKLLYKKVGYILSLFNENLKLSDHFFNQCKNIGFRVLGYFSQLDKKSLIYNKDWNMYVYSEEHIKAITGKGEYEVDV